MDAVNLTFVWPNFPGRNMEISNICIEDVPSAPSVTGSVGSISLTGGLGAVSIAGEMESC